MVLEWFVKAAGQPTPSPRGPEPDLWGAEPRAGTPPWDRAGCKEPALGGGVGGWGFTSGAGPAARKPPLGRGRLAGTQARAAALLQASRGRCGV